MNATVKSTVSRQHHHLPLRLPQLPVAQLKQRWLLISFGIATFLSAFAVVFVSTVNYQMVSKQQHLLIVRQQLHNQWSELLLQQGKVGSQAEISTLATQTLNMQMPVVKHVITLQP